MAYKLSLHGVSEGGQRKNPYVVGLRSELEARQSELVCEDIVDGVEDCRSIVEDKAINIKAWLYFNLSLIINTKVFPFPIFNVLILVKYCQTP